MGYHASRSALRVKLADNADNRTRCKAATDDWSRRMLAERYEPARRMLEEGYSRRFCGGP